MSRIVIAALCSLLLAGCGVQRAFYYNPTQHLYQAGAIFLGADVVSLASTDKTVDDHIIGLATDQDCSTLRASHGGPWCIPNPPPVAKVSQTSYCYKTLASASCFSAPVASNDTTFLGSRTVDVPAP